VNEQNNILTLCLISPNTSDPLMGHRGRDRMVVWFKKSLMITKG